MQGRRQRRMAVTMKDSDARMTTGLPSVGGQHKVGARGWEERDTTNRKNWHLDD